jgi:hypothetical protein
MLIAKPRCLLEGPTEGTRRHTWPPQRHPDRGHAPASWRLRRGERACTDGAVRRHYSPQREGPDRGHEYAGTPGCGESAHRRTRAGQSRRRERCVAAVVITVAVVRVIASVRVRSMTMRRRHRRSSSSSCHYLVAVVVVIVADRVVAPRGSGSGGRCCCCSQGEEKAGGRTFWRVKGLAGGML